MFLKINSNNKIKKVIYPTSIKTHAKFIEFVSDVLKKHPDSFGIYYMDNDGEKIHLKDDHDLDYFDQNYGTQKIREIFVEFNNDDFLEISFQQSGEHPEDDLNNQSKDEHNLKIQIEKQQSIINDLNNNIQQIQEENQQIQQQCEQKIKEILNEKDKEQVELVKKNENLKAKLEETQELFNQSGKQLKECQEKENYLNSIIQQKTTCIQEQKTQQQKKDKINEQKLAEMKLQLEQLFKELEQKTQHLNKQLLQNEESTAQLENSYDEVNKLKQKFKEVQDIQSKKDVKINELSWQIGVFEKNQKDHKTTTEELRSQIVKKDQKYKEIETQLFKLQEEYQNDIEKQKQYIKIQDEQIQVLEKKANLNAQNELVKNQLIPKNKEQNISNILEESNLSFLEQSQQQKDEVNKLNESFQQMQSQLSFFMEQFEKGNQRKQSFNSSVINDDIICSECKQQNFTGKRYLCMYCQDFNICELCEQKNNHPHLMIRIHGNENDPLLEFVTKKIKKFKNKKNKKCTKKLTQEKSKKIYQSEFDSKMKLLEFVYGQSTNEAQTTIRSQFVKDHIDEELEGFHGLIVANKKMFEQQG